MWTSVGVSAFFHFTLLVEFIHMLMYSRTPFIFIHLTILLK